MIKSLATAAVIHSVMLLFWADANTIALSYLIYPALMCLALLRKRLQKERKAKIDFIPAAAVKILLCLVPMVYSPVRHVALTVNFYVAVISSTHIVLNRLDDYFYNARDRLVSPAARQRSFKFISVMLAAVFVLAASVSLGVSGLFGLLLNQAAPISIYETPLRTPQPVPEEELAESTPPPEPEQDINEIKLEYVMHETPPEAFTLPKNFYVYLFAALSAAVIICAVIYLYLTRKREEAAPGLVYYKSERLPIKKRKPKGEVKNMTDISQTTKKLNEIEANIQKVIVGKPEVIRLLVVAFITGGHVLIEDVPGTGKTQLAKALAKSIGCTFKRVQFTPDLLPSDLTGHNVYNPKTGEFTFHEGSLFANIILGDEINRAMPRTQSGLLESMEERQITVSGVTYPLADPYFVMATQNPVEEQGVFPLPEAQLDRFLFQLKLGYPTDGEAVQIYKRFVSGDPAEDLTPVCAKEDIIVMKENLESVRIPDEVYSHIAGITAGIRKHPAVVLGVSPRAGIALARAARGYALITGRDYVSPEDIDYLVPFVFYHRLVLSGGVKPEEVFH